MEAVILGWDPDRGSRWVPPFERVLAECRSEGRVTAPWCLGTAAAPRPGTLVHLMLQGRAHGLVGRGRVRSSPYLAADPHHPGTLCPHVLITWDRLLAPEDRIDVAVLTARAPTVAWGRLYATVLALDGDCAAALDRIWAARSPLTPAARAAP